MQIHTNSQIPLSQIKRRIQMRTWAVLKTGLVPSQLECELKAVVKLNSPTAHGKDRRVTLPSVLKNN
uniref:Uncharacterized protein n=1 Tax=Arundo donax TaxID=35708 RepID=A0A0A9GQ54_ARUDO